jgi:uncharacterized protein (DUF736 family)
MNQGVEIGAAWIKTGGDFGGGETMSPRHCAQPSGCVSPRRSRHATVDNDSFAVIWNPAD